MDRTESERLHRVFMDMIRVSGLLQPDQAVPGQPLTLSQAFALHELDTDVPLSQRELAQRLRLEKSSVSRLVAVMEGKGLLVRERDPANRRTYRLRLTDRGRAKHGEMAGGFHGHFQRWISRMTRAERTALLTGLPAFVRAIRQDEDEEP